MHTVVPSLTGPSLSECVDQNHKLGSTRLAPLAYIPNWLLTHLFHCIIRFSNPFEVIEIKVEGHLMQARIEKTFVMALRYASHTQLSLLAHTHKYTHKTLHQCACVSVTVCTLRATCLALPRSALHTSTIFWPDRKRSTGTWALA